MPDARRLWTAGSTAPTDVSALDVARRADRFRRRVRLSHAAEYVAGVFVIGFFTAGAALPDWLRLPALSRVGSALIACACVFVLTYLRLRGTPQEIAAGATTLAAYRAELERRRALLASVVRWYLAPFWPGLILFVLGVALARRDAPGAPATLAFVTAVVVGTNVAIAWANHRAAARLARELAALPRRDEE
jgi:hypothetical protein